MEVDPGGGMAPGSPGESSALPRNPTTPRLPEHRRVVRPTPLGPLDFVESFVQPTSHELVDVFIERMFDYFDEDNDRLLNFTEFSRALRSLDVKTQHWTLHEILRRGVLHAS